MKHLERLLGIMEQLRDKERGCPWDVAQTFTSIAPHTIEEAYEVVDAIERKDMDELRSELGDLLLQIVFHAQMAKEQKLFTFDDVAQAICDKLVRRHPHVFADAKISTAAEQTIAWEEHKKKERAERSGALVPNPLEGVIPGLPALSRAEKIQERAAGVGFDWKELSPVFDKLQEELGELHHVLNTDNSPENVQEEIGDILFCCVNLARKLHINSEQALRSATHKFEERFSLMHAELDAQRRSIADVSLQELNDLWDQAKIAQRSLPTLIIKEDAEES